MLSQWTQAIALVWEKWKYQKNVQMHVWTTGCKRFLQNLLLTIYFPIAWSQRVATVSLGEITLYFVLWWKIIEQTARVIRKISPSE